MIRLDIIHNIVLDNTFNINYKNAIKYDYKTPTYSYTTAKYTTMIKSSIKYSEQLDLVILHFSHSSTRHCKSPLLKTL
jgi:hypothetical protein